MAVLSHQHEAQSEHNFAFSVSSCGAAAYFMPFAHFTNITNSNWHAIMGVNNDITNLLQVSGETDTLDEVKLASLDQISTADAQIVRFESSEHIAQDKVVLHESGRVGKHMVLLALAAPRVDLSNTRNGPKTWFDDPVVERCEFLKRVVGASDDVVIYFAQAGGNGAHLWTTNTLG